MNKSAALIHFVCDYAPGDLAISEVVQALWKEIPAHFHQNTSSVESFNTLETGFVVGQLALQDETHRPKQTILFVNCAPRKDRTTARERNEGEDLVYAITKSGVQIIAVNSGHSLSFVKHDLQELYVVNVERHGSQFRSRDYYPRIIGHVAREDDMAKILGNKLDPQVAIPDVPSGLIGYRDSFGNLKTTFRTSDLAVKNLQPGQKVQITINDEHWTATVATGSFNVNEGEFAFAPGSSGYGDRFWEIFQRGKSAWISFKKPKVGSAVQITVAS